MEVPDLLHPSARPAPRSVWNPKGFVEFSPFLRPHPSRPYQPSLHHFHFLGTLSPRTFLSPSLLLSLSTPCLLALPSLVSFSFTILFRLLPFFLSFLNCSFLDPFSVFLFSLDLFAFIPSFLSPCFLVSSLLGSFTSLFLAFLPFFLSLTTDFLFCAASPLQLSRCRLLPLALLHPMRSGFNLSK